MVCWTDSLSPSRSDTSVKSDVLTSSCKFWDFDIHTCQCSCINWNYRKTFIYIYSVSRIWYCIEVLSFISLLWISLIGTQFSFFSDYASRNTEGIIANTCGILIVIFGALVIFIATKRDYKRKPLHDEWKWLFKFI